MPATIDEVNDQSKLSDLNDFIDAWEAYRADYQQRNLRIKRAVWTPESAMRSPQELLQYVAYLVGNETASNPAPRLPASLRDELRLIPLSTEIHEGHERELERQFQRRNDLGRSQLLADVDRELTAIRQALDVAGSNPGIIDELRQRLREVRKIVTTVPQQILKEIRNYIEELSRLAPYHEKACQFWLVPAYKLREKLRARITSQSTIGQPTAAAANIIQRHGRNWKLKFNDGQPNLYSDLDGFLYLQHLIRKGKLQYSQLRTEKAKAHGVADTPSGKIAKSYAEEIRNGDHAEASFTTDAGTMLDVEALNSYHKRLAEIRSEIDTAKCDNDQAAVDGLDGEKAAILDQVKRATRPSHSNGRIELTKMCSLLKKDRDAVNNALKRAIGAISEQDQPLATHFGKSLVRRGDSIEYAPEHPIDWT